MGLICAITDKDLNEKSVEISNPKLRYGARGIVRLPYSTKVKRTNISCQVEE